MYFRYICPLPDLTPEGHRIFVFGLNGMTLRDFDFAELCRVTMVLWDLQILLDSLATGNIYIYDMSHFLAWPSNIYNIAYSYEMWKLCTGTNSFKVFEISH